MPRDYTLEIEELNDPDCGDVLGWFSKGHHENEAFFAALAAFMAPEEIPKRRGLTREYWRSACMGQDRFWLAVPGGSRGAFPVTVLEHW